MAQPTWSVLLAWANRPELARTLAENHAVYGHHSPEVVIANGGGDYAALCDLVRQSGVPGVRTIDLPGVVFNRSLCLNVAAHVCRGAYVLLFDTDMVARFDILGYSLEYMQRGGAFVTVESIVESDPARGDAGTPELAHMREMRQEQTFITRDGRRAVIRNRQFAGVKFGDNIIVMRRDDLVATGGLNSQLRGWGYEDTDFQLRIQFQLGLERIEHGQVLHLTHSAKARSPMSYRRNVDACFRNYGRCHYLGTFEQDRSVWHGARVDAPSDDPVAAGSGSVGV